MGTNATEQPIVTLSVSVTQKAYRKFFWHWIWHNRKGYCVSLAISFLMLMLFMVLFAWLDRDNAHRYVWYMYLLIFLLQAYSSSRLYNQHQAMYRKQTTYAFFEDHFSSRCDAMGTRHYKATLYASCKAAEAKSAFYLYYDRKRARPPYGGESVDPDPYNASAILDKEYLTEEQQQALRELFARKFGEKFISNP